MAIPTFNAVGFCAYYSKQGDWAFDVALELSKVHNKKLNVFYFLNDPYDPNDMHTKALSHSQIEKLAVQEEKELRLYYDERAGEFLNIGFRVCYDESWTELHRCLLVREFQLLVLGYVKRGAYFGKKPIEEFANNFISPVILVGPDNLGQLFFNSRATLLAPNLGLDKEKWQKSEIAAKLYSS
jgi:hypothetical protein